MRRWWPSSRPTCAGWMPSSSSTFGKGNLIQRDFGKNAYNFMRRSDGTAEVGPVGLSLWGLDGRRTAV